MAGRSRNAWTKVYGRHVVKSGMNRTEARYAQYLQLLKQRGEIKNYWFECLKLKIAEDTCYYLPDFLVQLSDDSLELHEVKGARAIFADDAKVKVKCAATQYPFRMFVVYPKKDGWEYEEY